MREFSVVSIPRIQSQCHYLALIQKIEISASSDQRPDKDMDSHSSLLTCVLAHEQKSHREWYMCVALVIGQSKSAP